MELHFQSVERKKKFLNPKKLVFKDEGEIKTFPDKQILRDFVSSRLVLQKVLKEVLWVEKK